MIQQEASEQPASETSYGGAHAALADALDMGYCVAELVFDKSGRAVDHRVVYVNTQFTSYTDLSSDEALSGKTVGELVPGIEPYWTTAYARVASTGKPETIESRSETLGRVYYAKVFPFDEGGRRVGVLFSDITDSLRELRQSEARARELADASERQRRLYETVLSNTPDLMYVFDLNHRFVYANEALLTMWGRTWNDAIGKNCLELGYEPWHAAMHDREIEQVVATKRPIRGVVPFAGTHGRRMYDYIFVPVMGDDGEVEAVAGATRDVTERISVEEALREANDLLEARVAERTADLLAANERLQGFTYHVSHDLRSPLRAISSTSRILLEDYGSALPQEAQEQLERQTQAAGKLGRLIDDLLRLSRVDRVQMSLQPFDLTALVRDAAEEALAMHPYTQVKLEIQEGMSATADPRLVRLALLNLIENAVKYSPGGGVVSVGHREDGTFFVADRGIGIDPQYFERIFEPFQRLHRDQEFPGTGIGLSNVLQVVQRHGGRVWVESAPGQGSTFLFTLSDPAEEPS